MHSIHSCFLNVLLSWGTADMYSHFPVSLMDWFQEPLHIPNSWPSLSADSAFTADAWICGCRIHRCGEPVTLRNLCKNKMQKLKSQYGLTTPSNEGRMFPFDGTIMIVSLHNILIHPHLSKPWKPCDLCILWNTTFAAEQKGGRKEWIARADSGLRASQGLIAKPMSTVAGGAKFDWASTKPVQTILFVLSFRI